MFSASARTHIHFTLLSVLNNLDRRLRDCRLTNPAGFCQAIFTMVVYPKDRNAVGFINVCTLNDGINLCMEKNLIIFSYAFCYPSLIRMGLNIGVLPNAKNVSLLIIDNSF
jgi:hypothetical protein